MRDKIKNTSRSKKFSNLDTQVAPKIKDSYRDIYLSHSKLDNKFVNELSKSIESDIYQGQNLLTWVEGAEIRPGQSIPKMINQGLEKSRFIGLVMTPDYFQNEDGWLEAEWYSVLSSDPSNQKAQIIPLLVKNCPYIPFLLRHLKPIDFRENYKKGLKELLAILKEEPLPRSVTYRGQLITSDNQIKVNRQTLFAEKIIPQADPDIITEQLYCNLLPIERLPQYIYMAKIKRKLYKSTKDGKEGMPSKENLKTVIRTTQQDKAIEHPFMPAFRTFEDSIVTFHDLEAPDGPLEPIINLTTVKAEKTNIYIRDEEQRKIVISLLNMAVSRHANRVGLAIDESKQGRFFFPPNHGKENKIYWTPTRRKTHRTVAKPFIKKEKTLCWIHQGAYLKVLFLNKKFYVHIIPTWVVTEDGSKVAGGQAVSKLIIKWTGPERNLQVLYHVRFWTSALRNGPGPISIRTGDQAMEIVTVPAFVQELYGIASDQKDLLAALDVEAPLLAREEERLSEKATEIIMNSDISLNAEILVIEDVELDDLSDESFDNTGDYYE